MAISLRMFACITVTAGLLAGCSVLPGTGGDDNRTRASAPAPRPQQTVQNISRSPAVQQCLSGLGAAGVQFTPLPDRYTGQGCSTLGTVQMTALSGDRDQFGISNIGPVTCSVGTAFAGWARYGVDRAARQIMGSPLARIETFGSYSCRDVAGTGRRSAHATASAIDISAFVLADGRRVEVKSDWNDGNRQEREFLRVVQDSACKRFSTVLGPEYNAAHRDHFHVEGVGNGNGRSFCR